MTIFGTHRSRVSSLLLLLTLPLALIGAPAGAQVNPLWDHYRVYWTTCPGCIANVPVTLTDQFGSYSHQVTSLYHFCTPVQKTVLDSLGNPIVYPIHDAVTHYSWWQISPQTFSAKVAVTNQFGDQTLNVHNAAFLLTPALKNTYPGPLPNANHYKAYECDGQPINRPVVLDDQLGHWSATLTYPRYFLTPARKYVGPGQDYPIVDPDQHYVCYEFTPADQNTYAAVWWIDQFFSVTSPIFGPQSAQYVLVPTSKLYVVPARQHTWGQLKALYR